MFGRRFRLPTCDLYRNTYGVVNARSADVAVAVVRHNGLPVAWTHQVGVLHGAMIDKGMQQLGLPTSPCDQCFKRTPNCPNELTGDPEELDYAALAVDVLKDLRKQPFWARGNELLYGPDYNPEELQARASRLGSLTVGDVMTPDEVQAVLDSAAETHE